MIPHFCYHPVEAGRELPCLVEIEKDAQAATACSTPVAEGMAVRTATTTVTMPNKSVLNSFWPPSARLPGLRPGGNATCKISHQYTPTN